MNEGGWLSECQCPCGCKTLSWSRWCFECPIFHGRRISEQVTKERLEKVEREVEDRWIYGEGEGGEKE